MAFDKRMQGAAEKRLEQQAGRQGLKINRVLDPIFWISLLFSGFLLKDKYKLNTSETAFIMDNVSKHRLVLWVNLIGGCIVYYGLIGSSKQELDSLISILIAPAFITGGAWFAITFGGVPQKLLDAALIITFWMFSAFTLSLTTMSITAYFVLDGNWLMLLIILTINFSVILSAILYDNIDGLKVGLDEALKDHSQAQLRYLKKHHGIIPPSEGQGLYEGLEE